MDEHDQILEQWNFKKVKIGNLVYPLADGYSDKVNLAYKRVRTTVPGRTPLTRWADRKPSGMAFTVMLMVRAAPVLAGEVSE